MDFYSVLKGHTQLSLLPGARIDGLECRLAWMISTVDSVLLTNTYLGSALRILANIFPTGSKQSKEFLTENSKRDVALNIVTYWMPSSLMLISSLLKALSSPNPKLRVEAWVMKV